MDETIYTTFTATEEKEIADETHKREIDHLKNEIKRAERDVYLLLSVIPIFAMFAVIIAKSNIILFVAFAVSWYYADKITKTIKSK